MKVLQAPKGIRGDLSRFKKVNIFLVSQGPTDRDRSYV